MVLGFFGGYVSICSVNVCFGDLRVLLSSCAMAMDPPTL